MSISQVHEALGTFEFELLGNVPREILDRLDFFSHIAIIPGRMDPRQYGDGSLQAARYVGVIRTKKYADDGRTNLIQDDIRLGGVGMEFWLGDDDNKGDVIEDLLEFTEEDFDTVIAALRPDSVSNGTNFPVSGTYSGRHQYETPRSAIKYICDTMSTEAVSVGYRVNNDGTLDTGPEADLYVTTPVCIILRKGGTQGEDMFLRALPSNVDLDADMEDFSTRVVMLAESNGESLATGTADIDTVSPGTNIYKDIHGNPLKLTRLVSESETIEQWADVRAELALREVVEPHRNLTLTTEDYDIHGTFEVGDYIWVYDPDLGLFDLDNEVVVRGVRVNPLKLRVTEAEWPVCDGYTVAHRDSAGNWSDITDYVHWEDPTAAKVTVGDYNRDLTDSGQSIDSRTGALIPADNSVPDQTDWIPGSFQTVNYVDGQGNAKSRQKLVWTTPLNTDGSIIQDGSHYEIMYKLDTGSLYSQTWAAASTLSWDELNLWDQPVEPDDVQYQTLIVPWGENTTVIHELPVGTGFDSRIRAVDKGNNQGAWSANETWITSEDNIPPSTPAPPVVAGSAIAIQVVHELGKASGGSFNLENDLAFIAVHYSLDEGFTPSDDNLAGRLRADRGMMTATTAAVGTFPIPETDAVHVKVVAVDTSGNQSSPSVAVEVSADLIDSQYISELTASKITAGEFGADYIISGSIRTAVDGQRVELNRNGLQAYDVNGDLSTNLSADPSATGEYISFRGTDGSTVASIADTGDAAFENVYANADIVVNGQSLLMDILPALPRGIIAMTDLTGDSPAFNGTDVLMGSVVVPNYDATRQYAIGMGSVRMDRQSFAGIDRITITAYYAWDSTPTTASTSLFVYQEVVGVGNASGETYTGDQNISFRFPFNFTSPAGTNLNVAFYFSSDETSTVGLRAQGGDGGVIYVEDVGLVVTRGSYDLSGAVSGGGGGGGGATQEFTKTYASTWTGSYDGDKSRRNSNGDCWQGQYDGTHGNQRSLAGFDYAQIQSDLAGATITKVEVQLKNKSFYNNSGGTVILGTHSYTAVPTTWAAGSVQDDLDEFTWAKLAKKYVTVINSIGLDLQSGVAKGIAIGPGPSTSKTYYASFAGQDAATADQPTIRITYTV